MKHRIIPAVLFLFSIWIGYHAALTKVPNVMMKGAYERLSAGTTPINEFSIPRMITDKNQTIVRPSPDLAYSVCLIDLSQGPIWVRGGKTEGYGSLTIFDMKSDVVIIKDLSAKNFTAKRSVLIGEGGFDVQGDKAIALIRRYAPNSESFERINVEAKADYCGPVKNQN